MMSKWIALSAVLHARLSVADAQFYGLTDPRYCYLLDGILFFYAIIVTALFFREKLIKKGPVVGDKKGGETYSELQHNAQAAYDRINIAGDTEKGMHRQMKSPDNSVYHGLQRDKINDPYSEIRGKQQPRRKGKDLVYQGLSEAQRDTYDGLQMQALH